MSSSRPILSASILLLALASPSGSSADALDDLRLRLGDRLTALAEARTSASIANKVESSLYRMDFRARSTTAAEAPEPEEPAPASAAANASSPVHTGEQPDNPLPTRMECSASYLYSLYCTVSPSRESLEPPLVSELF